MAAEANEQARGPIFDQYVQEHGLPDGQEVMLLQDLNQYVQQHGLSDGQDDGLSELNLAEERKRVQDESDYQEALHASIFSKSSGKDDQENDRERRLFLETLRQEMIDIQTSTDVIRGVPLQKLAESCDTILALASSRKTFGCDEKKTLRLSLESFHHEAVDEFLSLVMGTKKVADVSADLVVDCTQIAHYVQCRTVLDELVDILVRSIDTANCMSLCELANRLSLPLLFERSLEHMMQTLGDLEEHEVFGHLTPDLKSRILTIKTAIQTSIHSQRSRLYFGSLNEYLAIFAENVQYHRERLYDAKIGLIGAGPGRAFDYAEAKIAKQEQRIRTLEAVMEQQKKLFNIDSGESSNIQIEDMRANKRSRHVK